MLYYLTRILKKRGIFRRERRSAEIRALAIILYYLGLSFRDVSKLLRGMGFKVSYEAVRNWYHRCENIFN
jgi:transposase-like protein